MKKALAIIPFVLLMCFIFGCQRGEKAAGDVKAEQMDQKEPMQTMDLTQVRQAIEGANVKFGETVRLGDAAVLASLYTEDAKILPPNSEMIAGREGIEAFWGGGLQMGIKDAVLTTVEILGMGDMVCEIGKYDLSIQPEGQEAIRDSGKYLVIWKKDSDGTWKLHVDIWNTNTPAQ